MALSHSFGPCPLNPSRFTTFQIQKNLLYIFNNYTWQSYFSSKLSEIHRMLLPDHIIKKIQQIASVNTDAFKDSTQSNISCRSFYLYELSPMRQKIANLRAALPQNIEIYYAMKANPHEEFIKAALKAGVKGIEIASLGEGQKAIAAGCLPRNIIFTGPGKSPEELIWSVKNNIRTIHLESLLEAYRLNQICQQLGKKQDVLLRINPNFHIHGAQANFSGDSSKLGIDEGQVFDILPQILKLPNLNFLGLHVYAASGVLNLSDLLKNCQMVFDLTKAIESKFQNVHCQIIDFGGGFGIDYEELNRDFDPAVYAREIQKLITTYQLADRTFVLELGRYLTADSGYYCTEILDIKDSLGIKQVICAGGAHHFRRPVALGLNHPTEVVNLHTKLFYPSQISVKNEKVYLGGPLCNTADKLAPNPVYLKDAQVGDYIVIGLAGAYGYSMSHLEFLSHFKPAEIFLNI